MPRRNLHALCLISIFSLICYEKVPQSRLSRALAGAMDHVSRRFYLPVDDLDLFEGAMTGMIKALDDEHSIYVKVARKQEFEDDLNQEFVGIGIRPAIDPKTKQFLVLSPLPEGPAFAAGIRAGDRIERIEGQSTQGLSLQDAVERIRGKPGTAVTLTIAHPGAAQTVDLAIVRQVIHEDTVQGASPARTANGASCSPASGRSATFASPGSPARNRARRAPPPICARPWNNFKRRKFAGSCSISATTGAAR